MSFIDILHRHHASFLQTYGEQVTPTMRQAIQAMLSCQSAARGETQWHCQHCDHQQQFPLSCGHRSCPQCQHRTTGDWLARQQRKLLPIDYFMVTFTLPAQLRVTAQHHASLVYQAMFKVAAGILKDFARTSPRLKADIGFTAVLHTHNRRRDLHPHLHVVVTGGGFDSQKKQWRNNKGKYLFNASALAKVWRARLLDDLTHNTNISLPGDIPTKPWVVDCRHVGRGEPALKYLSRYLYRGVLPDTAILGEHQGDITFEYRDSETQTLKTRTLPAVKFLWLVLQHVLPKGFRRVRDYGFLRGNAKALLQQIQWLLSVSGQLTLPAELKSHSSAVSLCPCCHQPMQCIGIRRPTN